jgi:hypothetical protein
LDKDETEYLTVNQGQLSKILTKQKKKTITRKTRSISILPMRMQVRSITRLVRQGRSQWFLGGGDLHDRHSPVPDVNESDMFLFLAVVSQMGHDTWPTERQKINY